MTKTMPKPSTTTAPRGRPARPALRPARRGRPGAARAARRRLDPDLAHLYGAQCDQAWSGIDDEDLHALLDPAFDEADDEHGDLLRLAVGVLLPGRRSGDPEA